MGVLAACAAGSVNVRERARGYLPVALVWHFQLRPLTWFWSTMNGVMRSSAPAAATATRTRGEPAVLAAMQSPPVSIPSARVSLKKVAYSSVPIGAPSYHQTSSHDAKGGKWQGSVAAALQKPWREPSCLHAYILVRLLGTHVVRVRGASSTQRSALPQGQLALSSVTASAAWGVTTTACATFSRTKP